MTLSSVPNTITGLLRARAQSTPERNAWHHRTATNRWQPVSWGDLREQVLRIAASLRERGVEPGDRIAIAAKTRPEWQMMELAGLAAGAVIVGIDPHASSDHFQHVLQHSGSSVLVLDSPHLLEKVPALLLPQLQSVVTLTDHGEPCSRCELVSWAELLRTHEPDHQDASRTPSAADLATIIYTSGTTGTPKAIAFSHGQLMVACREILDAFPQIGEDDATICWLPMAHLFQRMINLVSMARGATVFFEDNPRNVMTCIAEVTPAVFVGVPRFFEKVYEAVQEKVSRLSPRRRKLFDSALTASETYQCHAERGHAATRLTRCKYRLLDYLVLRRVRRAMGSNLKFMISGSAPLAPEIIEFFHLVGLPILEAYGVSENTVPIAINRPDEQRTGSVGKPLPSNDVRLAEDGEVLVKGPGLFSEYFQQSTSQDCFTADGYYRTGDLGRLDADGFLYLSGRKSAIIKTSTGRRIAPGPIEARYCRSPLFQHLVVIGDRRKDLAGLVELNRGCIEAALADTEIDRSLPYAQFVKLPEVVALVRYELQTYGRALSPHEQVHSFALLPAPLTIDHGELTPTLKLRRSAIRSRYGYLMEHLHRLDDTQHRPIVPERPAEAVAL